MLQALQGLILEQAKAYTDPERLRLLDRQIEVALNEQIANLINEAETEASIPKNRSSTSLFTQRLCHHLDARKNSP